MTKKIEDIRIEIVNVEDKNFEEDLQKIIAIKQYIWEKLENKDFFVIDGTTKEYIHKAILKKGLLLKVVDTNNSNIVGFLIVSRAIRPSSEIMETFPNAKIEEYIEMDTVGVLSGYRGMHLQKKLIEKAEKIMIAKDKSIKYSIATVHPNNMASLKNFLNTGYEIVDERNMYNNKRRYVLKKNLDLNKQ